MSRLLTSLIGFVLLFLVACQTGANASTPPTSLIAFASNRERGRENLYTVSPTGTNLVALTESSTPHYSPDWRTGGLLLAFSMPNEGDDAIFTLSLTGQAEETLLIGDDGDNIQPQWSPDGEQIVFVSDRGGASNIYVADADGTNIVNLTPGVASSIAPAWSPDGSQIIYARDQAGSLGYDLFVINRDGTGEVQLTSGPADEVDAAWSPSGELIAYAATERGDDNADIFVMNADGGEPRNLTSHDADDRQPDWSPDGTQLVFATDRDDNFEIYVMNADGSNLLNLTNNRAADRAPDWSPVLGAEATDTP